MLSSEILFPTSPNWCRKIERVLSHRIPCAVMGGILAEEETLHSAMCVHRTLWVLIMPGFMENTENLYPKPA